MCKNLRRFIYISSLTAVGPSYSDIPIKESSAYHPVSQYGRSKMLAELEVLKLKGRLPFTILRPSGVYGPRDRDMLSYIAIIQKGLQPLIGFRRKWLNLIHRDDLVEGIIQAAESPRAENEIFFLGGEKNYTTEEIGDIIAKVVHKSRVKLPLPELLVHLVGGLSEFVGKISGQEVFFNRQKVSEAVQTYWTCSVEKAQKLLGFREKFSLEEGMRNTYHWYLDHHWL
jgi:nucleoside-diphosphate-sugar epimerase